MVTHHLSAPAPAIAPVAPVPSILTTARQLPADWQSGISWRPRRQPGDSNSISIDEISGEATCPDPADLASAELLDEQTAVPVLARLPWECAEVLPGEEDQFREEARQELAAATAWHLSTRLTTSIINAATAIDADDPVHPLTALAMLLANYADCNRGGGAIVHVPPVLIPTLLGSGAVKQSGDVYLGPGGSVVSPGPGGYWQNFDELVTGRMSITGPVEYALGDIAVRPEGNAALFDRRTNLFRVEAQRPFIYRFDESCTFMLDAFLPSPALGETE